MSYPIPIVRAMAPIVQAVETAVLAKVQAAELAVRQLTQPTATVSGIETINYQFGHLKEIIETLQQYEKAPSYKGKKYPLVWLILDYPEQYGNSGGYAGECTLQIIICYSTELAIKTGDRYAKYIKPILMPIYEELMKQIDASGYFVTYSADHIPHQMTEHPYWGRGGLGDSAGNVFADAVDAIEISEMKLKINHPLC